MRRSICVFLALLIVSVPSAAAQQSKGIVVGANVGGTYYCIVSRCDTGTTVGVMAGVDATRALAVEAAVRRHYCFDCDRFVIAEAAAVLQYRRRLISPFVAAGASYSSDPDFMGDHVGLLAAAGAWVWPDRRWGMRLELRGRQVGRGDAMGELSLSLVHRFVRP
jgi:hypothetical protein